MSRGRPPRPPPLRNLSLYHEVVAKGCSQRVVARRFRVSQPRVARVCQRLRAWVAGWLAALPPILIERATISGWSPEASRFHLAVALERERLLRAYGEYLQHFGGPTRATAYGQLLAALDAGVVPPEAAVRLPPRTLLACAVRMARELNDLGQIAKDGPFGDVLFGRC